MIYFGLDLGTNSLGISINNELNIVFGVENYNFSKGNYKKARSHLLQLMKKRNVYNFINIKSYNHYLFVNIFDDLPKELAYFINRVSIDVLKNMNLKLQVIIHMI